jgi:hypothetical protein
MAKKTATKAKRYKAKKKAKIKAEAKLRHVNMTELAGEAYSIHEPGEPRRRHKDHKTKPQVLGLEQKLMVIDNLLSKFTAGVSCEELDIIAMHMTAWAAELMAVHQPEVPDDKIHGAKVVFPTEPVLRLLDELQAFQYRNHHMTDDAIVDFLIMKLHGDTAQSAQLN